MAIIGFNAILYLVEVNAMEQSILNHTGKLYTFHPDIIWIFSNYRDLKINATHNCDKTSIRQAISNHVQHFKSLWNNIQAHSSAYIIQNNAELPLERVFGNFESTIHWGQINYIRNFNNQLAEAVMPDVSLLDIDYISSLFGKHQWFDEKFWYHSKHAFSFDAVGLVAFHGARLIAGIKGHAKKCLVLDLDNVLWGGNIGDEGLSGIRLGYGSDGEAFTDFQKYIKQLKDRGIILTVCSKNEEEIAKLPFEHHPNMVLKLDDITMFMANWKNKADNIREISNFLNIDLKSMVFIDDNPSERQLVRNTLETIAIPEISNDPASYIRTLDAQRYFELNYLSEEDKLRTKMYRAYKTHQNLKHSLGSISQYLQTLQMEAIAKNLDEFHLPRAAQLINKSNQFNLTTIRYTERQLKNMMKNKNIICRYYKLKDCCCDNGLIAIVILKKQKNHKLHIDSWVMSCRILGRNMENFVYNDIISIAKKTTFKF